MGSRQLRPAAVVLVLIALLAVIVFAGPVVQLNSGLIDKGPAAVRGSAGAAIADTHGAVLWTRVVAAVIFAAIVVLLLRVRNRANGYRS